MFSLGTVGILGIALAIILLGVIIIKRYKIAKPDEAIIVTGGRGKERAGVDGKTVRDLSSQKVVTGGGVFVLPFVQKSFSISLESRRLSLSTEAQTNDGITLNAQAVAVVKVGGTNEMIRAAAQRFLSNSDEIDTTTQEVLSGSLRALIGILTVDQIMQDRAAVAQKVLEAADEALTKQGLIVDTLQIQSIRDNQDYIINRGRPEAARVKQLAEISEVEAARAAQEAKIEAEKTILEKERELKINQADVQKETDRVAAEAAAAKPLEDARQRQSIVDQQQITAQKEVALREQQLNSDVRAEADAKAYAIDKAAQGQAAADVARAEADKRSRIAAAEAERAEGLAKAAAIEAVGRAEAAAIEARGNALAEQSSQILAQQMIEALPAMVEKYALALGGIQNMTVVSADGTSAVAAESISGVKAMMEMSKDVLGIDVPGLINSAVAGGSAGSAAARESKRETVVTDAKIESVDPLHNIAQRLEDLPSRRELRNDGETESPNFK